MKIGLDLRFLKENDLFSDFVVELILGLIKNSPKNTYNIYTNKSLILSKSKKIITKEVNIKLGCFKEQTVFYKILKKDNNNLMLFFNISKPIRYKGEYYLFIPSLNKIYYQNFDNYFKKYKYLYFLNNSTKNAEKIICFDDNTKDELSERLDIKEDKISIITPFFTGLDKLKNTTNLKLDIKLKNNIKNPFLLYNGGTGIEKNIDRLIKVISKINKDYNIDLVILGEEISKDISIRDLIISETIQHHIHFIGEVLAGDKKNYYDSSIGVIFPSLYESFPFHLNEAVFYNTNIITGNLDNIKKIFEENISYFFPISTSSMIKNINKFIEGNKTQNHDKILNNINAENTISKLIEIIK